MSPPPINLTKCHQNLGHFVCVPCAKDKNNCPICLKKINPHDVWSESSWTMHPIYILIFILPSIITTSVGLLIKVLLLPPPTTLQHKQLYTAAQKKPAVRVVARMGATRFNTRFSQLNLTRSDWKQIIFWLIEYSDFENGDCFQFSIPLIFPLLSTPEGASQN